MTTAQYGYTRILKQVSFDAAVEKVTSALKEEGFGVLMELNIQETLKKKLDVDFRKYKILGACNPPLAHKALSNEPLVGLLLPCNVTVFEENDGSINVSLIKPKEMFKVINNPDVASIADEVDAKLQRVLERLVS